MKRIVACAIAVLMLGIAMWSVVPAPSTPLLVLAVTVPEFALPLLAVYAVLSIALVLFVGGYTRVAVIVLCALSLCALSIAPLQAPGAWSASDARLTARGFGPARARSLAAIDVTAGIRIPLRDGGDLALDLYRPHGTAVVPVIVSIHGGAWRFGSRASDAAQARWYAERGFAVAVIDYRHAPAHRFPAQIDDVDDALNAIALHAAAWHIDDDRAVLFGRSAGAQLALLAGERPQLLRIRGIVAYYAPIDLIGGWKRPPVPDPAGVRRMLETYLGGPPDAAHASHYRAAAPLQNAHADMPPVLSIGGERDELVAPVFARAFALRLDALHVRNVALEIPWSNHAFDAVNGLGAALAHDATLRFLDALL
jgi:acetyl esterase/lipase